VRKTVFVLVIALGLIAAEQTGRTAQRPAPEAYIPASLDGLAVNTCRVDVGGASTCSREAGPAASDAIHLGLVMMTAAGLTSTDDTRWEYAVYGATGASCLEGGTSLGAMRTHSRVSQAVRDELAAVALTPRAPFEDAHRQGLALYVGDLPGEACTAAFGYPDDSTVLLVLTGKGNRERATRTIDAMLGAAKATGIQP